jgi:hypothetical protein
MAQILDLITKSSFPNSQNLTVVEPVSWSWSVGHIGGTISKFESSCVSSSNILC